MQSLTLLTASGAIAGKQARPPAELYHMLLQAQSSSQAADEKMRQYMDSASNCVARYHRRHNGFPNSSGEVEELVNLLSARPIKNPYYESEMLAKQLPATESHQIQYQVNPEYGLSKQSADSMAKRPPNTWRAVPGTISILHNSENSFALWSAGIDGSPIKDGTTNSAHVLFRDLSD